MTALSARTSVQYTSPQAHSSEPAPIRPQARPSRPRTECARQSVSSEAPMITIQYASLPKSGAVHERARWPDLRLA